MKLIRLVLAGVMVAAVVSVKPAAYAQGQTGSYTRSMPTCTLSDCLYQLVEGKLVLIGGTFKTGTFLQCLTGGNKACTPEPNCDFYGPPQPCV